MTTDGFTFVQRYFSEMWRFFISFYVPGTNLTPAALAIGVFLMFFLVRFIRRISSAMLSTGGSE